MPQFDKLRYYQIARSIRNRWGTARIEGPERGVAVTLRSDPALSHLVIFTPPDRPFIAVEPVSHMIDALNRAHLFLDTPRNTGFDPDTGIRIVAPRARFAVRMQLWCSEFSETSTGEPL